jgi:hypothetical protein
MYGGCQAFIVAQTSTLFSPATKRRRRLPTCSFHTGFAGLFDSDLRGCPAGSSKLAMCPLSEKQIPEGGEIVKRGGESKEALERPSMRPSQRATLKRPVP